MSKQLAPGQANAGHGNLCHCNCVDIAALLLQLLCNVENITILSVHAYTGRFAAGGRRNGRI